MKSWRLAITLAALSLLLAFALAAAQEPVKSFDQLNTRLKPGDTVWITDARGREIEGRIESLAPDAITLDAGGARIFAAADVGLIRDGRRDSLKTARSSAWASAEASRQPGASPPPPPTTPLSARAWSALREPLSSAAWARCSAWPSTAANPGKGRVAYRAPRSPGAARRRASRSCQSSRRAQRASPCRSRSTSSRARSTAATSAAWRPTRASCR